MLIINGVDSKTYINTYDIVKIIEEQGTCELMLDPTYNFKYSVTLKGAPNQEVVFYTVDSIEINNGGILKDITASAYNSMVLEKERKRREDERQLCIMANTPCSPRQLVRE